MKPGDLYGLPLEQFVPERGALAKALRDEGKRAEAAEVGKLRKPSVAAWAVNQLVRTQGNVVEELFDAGDALHGAQEDLLAGRGDGASLRAANERERTAVDRLVDAGRGLLSSDGHELSPAIVERVADTLHAAALDASARELVREGRLEKELRHVGLGLGGGVFAAAAPPHEKQSKAAPEVAKKRDTPAKDKPAKRDPKAHDRAKAERAEATRVEAERAAARKAARVAEAQTRRRGERAANALRAAEERRERAVAALDEADEALAAAREEARSAVDAHALAKSELDDA